MKKCYLLFPLAVLLTIGLCPAAAAQSGQKAGPANLYPNPDTQPGVNNSEIKQSNIGQPPCNSD